MSMLTRLSLAFALFCASVAGAQAQRTKSTLLLEIGSFFPDNTINLIVPLSARTFLSDFVNSDNVSGTSCLGGQLTLYQPFTNTSSNPVSLQIWDGTQCVTWGSLNTTTHAASLATALNFTATTSPFAVNAYGAGNNAVAANFLLSTDSGALSGTERHTLFVQNNSAGTGDGSIIGATYASVLSALKINYLTTTTPGQTGSLVLIARGGVQGTGATCPAASTTVGCGDTAALQWNVIQSANASSSIGQEGVVTYSTDGTTTCSGCVSQRNSISLIRHDQGLAYGYTTQAVNGTNGVAYYATNTATGVTNPGTWNAWITFNEDDGTHAVFPAYQVNPSTNGSGSITLAGFGAAGTNQKTIRCCTSFANTLEFLNAASNALLATLNDSGAFTTIGAHTIGLVGGSSGSVTLLGSTSGSTVLSVDALGRSNVGRLRYCTTGVNFNSANTDNAISIPSVVGRYAIDSVRINNASASISAATIGVFTATGGGGQTIAVSQAITVTATATDTNNNTMSLTISNQNTEAYNDATLQARIGTAAGGAATGDVCVYIVPMT